MHDGKFTGSGQSSVVASPSAALGRGGESPVVWLLLGERQGDNAQVRALGLALCQTLGWRSETRQLYFDEDCQVPFSKRGSTLTGLDIARSEPLKAPWPDVILAVGRRTASVSQWIKKQTGGRALSIHLGRVRDAIERFDLILTTPQYALPSSDNVLETVLPMTHADEAELVAAASDWQPQLDHLPRPWTALFVGGPTTQMKFDAEVAEDLLDKILAHVGGKGSLLVTTSPRTSMDVCDLIEHRINVPNYVFRWSRGAPNPYRAFLKLADSFVVTNDSPAMVAELVDRQKPVFLYEIPFREKVDAVGMAHMLRQHFRGRRLSRQKANLKPDLIDWIYDHLIRKGKARPRRDAFAFTQSLYRIGAVHSLTVQTGAKVAAPDRPVTAVERDLVVARIKKLYDAKGRK